MHKWWPKTGGSLFKQLNGSKTATRKLTSGRLYYLTSSPLLDLHSSHKSFKHFETNNPLPVVGMIKWLWGLTDRFSWASATQAPFHFFLCIWHRVITSERPGPKRSSDQAEGIRWREYSPILESCWEICHSTPLSSFTELLVSNFRLVIITKGGSIFCRSCCIR